jgi:sugar lactone lactonase YvrE
VDAGLRRLWAVNSDLGASLKPSREGPKRLAGVGVYDLETGKAIRYVDLSPLEAGPHLLNGIALDPAGDAYVTDSFSPVIYKVAANGKAGVFLRDARFEGSAVNLNGLAVHPDGYLLVIKKSDGSLFKVPLDRPGAVAKVAIDRGLVGGDGVTLAGRDGLAVIANRTPGHASDSAFFLTSQDGWASARVTAARGLGNEYPTTAVFAQGILYVVQARLDELLSAPSEGKSRLRGNATIRAIGRMSARPGGTGAAEPDRPAP